MANKQLMYRKTILKTVYRFSKVFDEVMDYEEYKQMILNKQKSDFKYFNYIKGLNDCYYYILKNDFNEYDSNTVKELHKLLFNKTMSKETLCSFNILYNKKNSLIENAVKLFNEIYYYTNYDRYAFAYVILIYLIYLNRKRFYNISNMFCINFYQMITESNFDKLNKELELEFQKTLTPDEKYFDNLIDINPEEIINYMESHKEEIKERFLINHLYLYGSFIKNTYRIDSDIDIAGEFTINLPYVEKNKLVVNFKNYILENFKRYGDFMEFNEELLKGEEYKKIF